MKAGFDVEGLDDLDATLAELPKATSRAVVRRALVKELTPVAEMANGYWPGSRDDAFAVSGKLRSGQPAPDVSAAAVTMFVGATQAVPHAHLLEWGTGPRFHKSGRYVGAVSPIPMLTPAWDAHKERILQGLADSLRKELEATIARRARRGS